MDLDRKPGQRTASMTETITFAILLPLTSRGLPASADDRRIQDMFVNLEQFAKTLADTTSSEDSSKMQCKVFVGLDSSDAVLRKQRMSRIKPILEAIGIVRGVEFYSFSHPPGAVCYLWKDLASVAYRESCDYYVLFGDDIELHTPKWMSWVVATYKKISRDRNVPFGFGCVCFTDRNFPGMPTFPVMHKTHLDIFNGRMFPSCFINQHADPFLFQLYRSWGAAIMSSFMHLSNGIGGSRPPRYDRKEPTVDWTHKPLTTSKNTIEAYLNGHPKTSLRNSVSMLITIDVVIPSIRFPIDNLQEIFDLPVCQTCSVMFIVVVDTVPLSAEGRAFVKCHEKNPSIRFRFNRTNMGASFSRNRGLEESAADYVLFLDDDVIPDKDLLIEYESAVRAHPRSAGIVGRTTFPTPKTNFQNAVHLSCVTYFWTIADFVENDVPWGVTANLLVKRSDDGIRFDVRFPRTGGGEDIDFCLKKSNWIRRNSYRGEGFVSGKLCKAVHPWWNGGKRSYWRFYMWAVGDGLLVNMYPQLTYKNFPNAAEVLLFIIVVCFLAVCVDPRNTSRHIGNGLVALFLNLTVETGFELLRHLLINPDIGGHTITAQSWSSWTFAVAESALICVISEAGRTVALLRTWPWNLKTFMTRFDWFAGKAGNTPRRTERIRRSVKFLIWVVALYLLHLS